MHTFSVFTTQKVLNVIFFQLFPMGISHGSAPNRSSSHGKMDGISHVSLPSRFQHSWNFENLTSLQLPPLPSHGSQGPIIHTIQCINKLQYTFMSKMWYKSLKCSLIQHFFSSWGNYSTKMLKKASKDCKTFDKSHGSTNGRL